ncbi:type II CAAX prenyl endopeptidase Rce1 family protein [Phenylobacterium sp.]|uniref:CPBP family glutamic-type intramembrane protease n=1 Tax=Phenylobacterium sp. TaxID=1871053 RepID=UPI0028A28846|nr:CPBP family glutamic-type intramembrane protease [Phenylobacterium sp.]
MPLTLHGWTGRWLAVGLFVSGPLLGLALVAGYDWTRLFRRLTWSQVWLGLAFAPIALLTSALVALGVNRFGTTTANPSVDMLAHIPLGQAAQFLASVPLQLLGEELITVVVLLAVSAALLRVGASRGPAIAGGWLVSAVVFGALHLPTYQWHVLQALLVIGSSRLVLSLPYLWTRNLWVSTLAHIALDGSLMIFALLAGMAGVRPVP